MTAPNDETTWNVFGCYFAADHQRRVWRFSGSRTALSVIPSLLMRTARDGEPSGPFQGLSAGRFTIRVWERPGIDDEGIYGPPDDLERLAALIEGWLAEAGVERELRIARDFAADAEYALVVQLSDDDVSPVPPVRVIAEEGELGTPQEVDAFPPFQFSFYDIEDEIESQGLFTLTQDALLLEFHLKDEDDETPLPVVHEKELPVADIASLTFKRGVIGPILTIQTHTAKALGGLPAKQLGRVTLRFKRKDRDEVERMVAVLESRVLGTG